MPVELLLALVTAGAVLCLVLGLESSLQPDTSKVDKRLQSIGGQAGWLTDDEQKLAASVQMTQLLASRVEQSVSGRGFAAALHVSLVRADLKLSVGEFLIVQGIVAVIPGAIALLISSAFPVAVAFAVAGWFAPRLWLRRRHAARLRAFNSQLSDALALMSNSLRSGLSLVQSMETMAHEAEAPTSDEFQRVVREIGLGVTPQDALRHFSHRIASDDLDLAVTAILVQFEVGGNLSKVLDSIANTIRERVKLHGEIRTLSAQGRMAGYMLTGLPIVIGGILMLVAPSYIGKLFTPGPWLVLPLGAVIGMFVGSTVMSKMTNIQV